MEAKELRIGNLVKANGLHGGEMMEVSAITDKGTLSEDRRVIMFKESNNVGEFISDCEGIELTPEWLDRFGFKRQNNAWNGPHKNDFSLWNPPGTDEITFNDTVMCPKIDHIHQLQNLYFALTGRELELKK